MSTTIESKPTDTHQRIESDADRAKFLRRIMREDGWIMRARASEDWQVMFCRTVKGEPGSPDVDITVRLADKVSTSGKWGPQQSFSDSNEVIVPKPTRLCLHYGTERTAARFLLDGCGLSIRGSAGSTASSKHGLAFVSLEVRLKGGHDTVEIGGQSVYINGRMVCCGSVE